MFMQSKCIAKPGLARSGEIESGKQNCKTIAYTKCALKLIRLKRHLRGNNFDRCIALRNAAKDTQEKCYRQGNYLNPLRRISFRLLVDTSATDLHGSTRIKNSSTAVFSDL